MDRRLTAPTAVVTGGADRIGSEDSWTSSFPITTGTAPRRVDATPTRALGTVIDVASIVAFHASQRADNITRRVIGVTGGVDFVSV